MSNSLMDAFNEAREVRAVEQATVAVRDMSPAKCKELALELVCERDALEEQLDSIIERADGVKIVRVPRVSLRWCSSGMLEKVKTSNPVRAMSGYEQPFATLMKEWNDTHDKIDRINKRLDILKAA